MLHSPNANGYLAKCSKSNYCPTSTFQRCFWRHSCVV